MTTFSIVKDEELISAGTHFWCKCCTMAVPVERAAPVNGEPVYCKDCADVLKQARQEMAKTRNVKWTPGGNVCIVDGMGYKVSGVGETFCIGKVDENGKTIEDGE